MARDPQKRRGAGHRGRIQAQGGGIEESVTWARATPPTVSEVLAMCDELAGKLTRGERTKRKRAFENLRKYIAAAAQSGGVSASPRKHSKSFLVPDTADVRVDLEVQKGLACVPERSEGR